MERSQTLLLPELAFSDLVKLFRDTSVCFPVSALWVPHLIPHDIIRITSDSAIALLLEILDPERAWMYGYMKFVQKPNTNVIRKMEEVSFPVRLAVRNPIGYFKEQTYQHIHAKIQRMHLFIPECIPENFFQRSPMR